MKDQINKAVAEVLEGVADPLEVYAFLYDLEKYISEAKKSVQEYAIHEAEKFGQKTFEHKGLKFTRNEGRKIYDFKRINKWVDLRSQLDEVERLAKQAATSTATLVDEHGEIIEPAIVKFSSASLIVKI